jgi:hypothetical protein
MAFRWLVTVIAPATRNKRRRNCSRHRNCRSDVVRTIRLTRPTVGPLGGISTSARRHSFFCAKKGPQLTLEAFRFCAVSSPMNQPSEQDYVLPAFL